MLPRMDRLLTLCLLLLTGASLLRASPTVQDFFKRPEVSEVSISQDGRYLAYLTPSTRKYYDLNAIDLAKGEPYKFDLKQDDVMYYYWRNKDQLVLGTQKLPIYWWREVLFDLNQHKYAANLSNMDVFYHVICEIKDRPGLYYAFFPSRQRNQPEIAIIDSKRLPTLIGGINNSRFNIVDSLSIPPGEFHGCFPDHRGEIRAVLVYQDGNLRYHYRESAGVPWRQLPLDPEHQVIKGLTADPDVIFVVRDDVSNRAASLHRYSISHNEYGPSLLDDPEYAMTGCKLMMTEDRKELLGITYEQDREMQILLSPLLQEVQARADKRLPGRSNLIRDYDEKLTRFVISSRTDRGIRYFLLDRSTGNFSALPDPFPQLPAELLRPMRTIRYTARDGLALEGFLTLPAPTPGQARPPLIVMPHGGPWVRDAWGFDREAQFFASRGYAVFQPNYRGSSGYAKAVSLEGEFEFRKMHDDVTDGVRHLVSAGLVDPERLAIFGGSFGGYLALCGAAYEPNLYRCAVTFAGVFDWARLVKQSATRTTRDRFNYEFLVKHLGDPKKSREQLEAISPINHVSAIKVPVFVLHGKEDETVEIAQSERLLAELDKYHVPHETLFFDDEGHGLSEEENRTKCFTAIEKFLGQNLAVAAHGKN